MNFYEMQILAALPGLDQLLQLLAGPNLGRKYLSSKINVHAYI